MQEFRKLNSHVWSEFWNLYNLRWNSLFISFLFFFYFNGIMFSCLFCFPPFVFFCNSSTFFCRHFKYSSGYLLKFVSESSFFYRSCKCFWSHRHNQLNRDIPLIGDACPISLVNVDRCHLVSHLHFHIHTKRAQKLLLFLLPFDWHLLCSDVSHLFNIEACLTKPARCL